MAGVTVGGMTIMVSPDSVSRPRDDGADRRRAFDNTYRVSQVGGAARDFVFSTPPVLRATADIYEAQLSIFASQMCSGDVIARPTMCCAEITGWHPIRLAVGHGVVIDFVLHEVQPAKMLLKYSPGDTITGEAFTRSTIAYQINAAGVLVSVAVNTKRDGHYIGGVRSLLLEGAATNSLLHANDFSNAAWVKNFMTITTGLADPAGGTTACTLTATGTNAEAYQQLANGSSIVRANSAWIRRRTGAGPVKLFDNTGAFVTVAPTASWQRFSAVGGASVIRIHGVQVATSGDAVDVWMAQQEDGGFRTSEIPTTTVAVTRGADSYSLPFTTPPQEMTVYAKFVEGGTISLVDGTVFVIADASSSSAALVGFAPGGFYRNHHLSGSNVGSTLATAPVYNDTAELCFGLFGDGSVDVSQSINGGAVATSAQSAALALAAAWSGLLFWPNGTPVNVRGFTALQSLKIVAGSRSLVEMRAL